MKKDLQAKLDFHLDRVDALTRTAKLCRKMSNKLKLLGWINRHAKLATQLQAKINGWS